MLILFELSTLVWPVVYRVLEVVPREWDENASEKLSQIKFSLLVYDETNKATILVTYFF